MIIVSDAESFILTSVTLEISKEDGDNRLAAPGSTRDDRVPHPLGDEHRAVRGTDREHRPPAPQDTDLRDQAHPRDLLGPEGQV